MFIARAMGVGRNDLWCTALELHRKPKPAIQEPFPECTVSSF